MKKLVVICALILNACTAYSLVEPGKIDVGGAYYVTVDSAWSRSQHGHIHSLTKDGFAIQAIQLSTGVKEKEHFFTAPTQLEQPPYKKDLSLIELQQFIHDSFVASGAEKISFSEIRPESFGGAQGIRAEFDFYTKSGLHKRAIIAGAQNDGKFYFILYHAPNLYFFDKNKQDAEDIIRSVTFKKDT